MLGVLQGMGRISRRLGNRGSLSSKRGNKNFYKGTGGRKEGAHTVSGEPPAFCGVVARLRRPFSRGAVSH